MKDILDIIHNYIEKISDIDNYIRFTDRIMLSNGVIRIEIVRISEHILHIHVWNVYSEGSPYIHSVAKRHECAKYRTKSIDIRDPNSFDYAKRLISGIDLR